MSINTVCIVSNFDSFHIVGKESQKIASETGISSDMSYLLLGPLKHHFHTHGYEIKLYTVAEWEKNEQSKIP